MVMIKYRHPDGQSWFKQYAKDPVPAWAVDVQPHREEDEVSVEDKMIQLQIRTHMSDPAYAKAMDAYYEQKWAHRFD